jgi:enoyl-CoA hydratase/carnithine racemase
MPEPGRITLRRDGAVGWVVFDNEARRNAVSIAMWQQLAAAMADYGADPGIRIVVLTGAGERAFVSGADISEFEERRASPEAIAEYGRISGGATAALRGLRKPTIAMIRGYCFGGGVGLALACDLRIAAEDAVFAIPAARLGLAYPFDALKLLTDIVGPAYAKEILFTARRYGAAEAQAMGLVNRVVPVAGLSAAVAEWTAMIADNAPLTATASKLAVDAVAAGIEADRAAAEAAAKAALDSEDYREGRRAFMAKRRPVFTGR